MTDPVKLNTGAGNSSGPLSDFRTSQGAGPCRKHPHAPMISHSLFNIALPPASKGEPE